MTTGLAGCLDEDERSLEGHLADANRYDDEFADRTGRDEVQVDNGVGTPPAFDPPAIEVDEDTTVRWRWVSDNHSVTHTTGDDFDSGIHDDGSEFEYTFDETGEYLYHCQPHRQVGQRGAVVVG